MFSKDLKQFLDEHYKPAPALALPTKEVREAYKRWAQEHNKSKLNYTSFNNVVEKEYNIINGFIHGITLKTTPLEPQLINAPAVASSEVLLSLEQTLRQSDPSLPVQAISGPMELNKALMLAKLNVELREIINLKNYFVKESFNYFEKAEKKIDEINALKNQSLPQD